MTELDPIVFVYGTLRRGGSNSWRMHRGQWIAAAQVHGFLYAVSSCYPGLVLDPQGSAVRGDLFRVSAAHLAELDAFEGDEYRLTSATAEDLEHQAHEVLLWNYVAPLTDASLIESGDWLVHLDAGDQGLN